MARPMNVSALIKKLRLKPESFAREFMLPLHLVRKWCAREEEPKNHYRVYLLVIKQDPEAVRKAVADLLPGVRAIPERKPSLHLVPPS